MPTVTVAPRTVTLDFSHADQRLSRLRERAEQLAARHAAASRGLFELEKARAEMAGEIAARRKLTERREEEQRRNPNPALAVLPQLAKALAGLDVGPERDRLLERFGGVLTEERDKQATALAANDAELAKLDKLVAAENVSLSATTRRSQSARAIVQRAETWLRERNAMAAPPPFVVVVDDALPDDVDELRALLLVLEAERVQIEQAPVPLAEAMSRLRQAVETARAGPAGLSLTPFMSAAESPQLAHDVWPPPSPLTLLARLAPDVLLASVQADLNAAYQRIGNALSAGDRQAALTRIEEKRRSVELREEMIIRRGDPDSGPIRRNDAKVELVLGEWEYVQ